MEPINEQEAMDRLTSIAAQNYTDRQSRATHPAGDFDKQGRWYPTKEELCDCCKSVRSPSKNHPYSYMKHCRTIKHIAALHGVDEKALKKAIRQTAARQIEQMDRDFESDHA